MHRRELLATVGTQEGYDGLDLQEGTGCDSQSPDALTYVRRVTRTAKHGGSLDCQGLHNALILAYGFSRTVRFDRRLSPLL